jgi:membrane-associated phospholipid phosphatase
MKKFLLLFFIFLPISIYSQNIDIQILRAINSPQILRSDDFFRVISNSDIYVITEVPVIMGIVGFVKHDNKLLRKACVISGATIINFGITSALKYSINRERPFIRYHDIINKSGKPTKDPSFPSGHTSTAFTLATSLSLEYPKWYIIAPSYLYACTVGYSRLYLGVHYPSDVLIGALVGTGSAYLTHLINKKIKLNKHL